MIFDSEIDGLACKVKVTHYHPAQEGHYGHPDDHTPPEPAEFEYALLDYMGNPAPELEDLITEDDDERFLTEFLNLDH